jgi:hypothetical protein
LLKDAKSDNDKIENEITFSVPSFLMIFTSDIAAYLASSRRIFVSSDSPSFAYGRGIKF